MTSCYKNKTEFLFWVR